MNKLVVASSNKHKIEEIKSILTDSEILSLSDINFQGEIEENGNTFLENSLIKAKAVYEYLKSQNNPLPVLADDSGLCVDVLDGAPGVHSARYASKDGGNSTSEENRAKLIVELDGVQNRRASFVCAITLYGGDDNIFVGIGKTNGEIGLAESGDKGFGYDCLFYSYDLCDKFSEVTPEEKNSVSHRARALKSLLLDHNKLHFMHLYDEPFEKIAKGEKTIELRLFDDKRKALNKGDYICFTNTKSGKKCFVKITELKNFKNLKEATLSLDQTKLGCSKEQTKEEILDAYHSIYSEQEEQEKGVLAISISLEK